jgi:Leucine-rich repeat (LRR) protein/predicted DNA-binding WGR domain protein
MKRNFICQNGNSGKYWSIEVQGNTLTTTYGKIEGTPKSSSKDFPSAEKCMKEAEKIIAKKLKEEYEEVMLNIAGVDIHALKQVEDAQKNGAEKLYINVHRSPELAEEVCRITSLKNLYITNLTVLPASIGNLKKLEVLEIEQSHQLESIPDEIGLLKNLRKLNLKDTAIRSIPNTIGQLSQLKKVHIWSNRNLQSIPASINQLKKLEQLWITSNREVAGKNIETLPLPADLFKGLDELEELDLSSNNLSEVPESLATLKQLKKLRIQFNNFEAVPPPIFALENLEWLNLSYGNITTIPAELCRLEHLAKLEIDYRSIKHIPAESLQNGMIGIRRYFKENTNKKINNG